VRRAGTACPASSSPFVASLAHVAMEEARVARQVWLLTG
jgi:hypothetical protein